MKKPLAHFLSFLCVCIAGTTVVAHAQTYSVLYNFGSSPGDPHVQNISGAIAQGRNGFLYSGAGGGAHALGAIYDGAPSGGVGTLYSFNRSDGADPEGGVTLGIDGNFYGTTNFGGANGFGTIFRITPSHNFVTLHDFTSTEGSFSYAPPVQGADGNFYGTTRTGGTRGYGCIYKISPLGQFTVLYQFDGTTLTGTFAPLLLGTDGALYGTSPGGGPQNYGAIFRITTSGQVTVLHNFDNVHGAQPFAALYQGTDGNFYGTSAYGGAADVGVVFQMTPTGSFTVLHEMNGLSDGAFPEAGLVQGTDGNFYGANSNSGAVSGACPYGCGTLFKITPQGVFTVLYNFDHIRGDTPVTAMMQHTNGLLYGGTLAGGSGTDPNCDANCGVFYSLNAGLAPFVSLSPFSGKHGDHVVILGQGFNSSSSVTFNNVTASYTLVSSTCLIATVPPLAMTGRVTVTTLKGSGRLVSNRNFIVH